MRKYLLVLMAFLVLSGCAAPYMKSFSTVSNPSWMSMEIRDGVSYDRAWSTIVSILVKDFDMVMLSKQDGYIQTDWLYSWTGVYQPDYRVRVKVKFSDDGKKLDVKTEAQTLVGNMWVAGVDERLVSTLKTDIMGTIGRTTR